MSAEAVALTQSVRELLDAVVRTDVDEAELAAARKAIEAVTAQLQTELLPGSFGLRYAEEGRLRAGGNPVVGFRNAFAPPVQLDRSEDGTVSATFDLGAVYEGPPGMVHGGVTALLLDQALGEAAHAAGRPGMTGTLELKYLAPLPLGRVRMRAKAEPGTGYKTTVRGWLYSLALGEEVPCAEAVGLFILPKWARESGDMTDPSARSAEDSQTPVVDEN